MHVSEAINILEGRKPHDVTWVTKKGETVTMQSAVLLSSSAKYRRMNLKSTISGEIRKVNYVQLIELDGEEIWQ